MMGVETIFINDKEYLPLKEIEFNKITYYILMNIKDNKDICVRKEIEQNGEILISMLDSEEELKTVLSEYKKLVENK